MRRLMLLGAVAAMAVAGVPALAQSGPCSTPMLRGVWCMTCSGFTELSNLDRKAPKGTLVPFVGIGRGTIDADGKGAVKAVFNIAGTLFPVELEESFKVNPDCTGEKTYTLKAPGGSLPGKATVVYMPNGLEFRIMTLVPGDVVTCEYKKMFNTLLPM